MWQPHFWHLDSAVERFSDFERRKTRKEHCWIKSPVKTVLVYDLIRVDSGFSHEQEIQIFCDQC